MALINDLVGLVLKKNTLKIEVKKRKVHIFVAGSITEIEFEMNDLTSDLLQLNNKMKDIEINVMNCKLSDHDIEPEGEQAKWNEYIKNSNIFVALIYNDIGTYTQKEIELAINSKIETGKPENIYICYLESAFIGAHEETNSLSTFKNYLQSHYGNYWHAYSSVSEVKSKIKDCVIESINYVDNRKSRPIKALESSDVEIERTNSNIKKSGVFVWHFLLSLIIIGLFFALFYVISMFGYFSDTGKCGDNLTWTLKGNTLVIDGYGTSYNWSTFTPWFLHKKCITSLIIKPGVNGVGNNIFNGLSNLSDMELPDTLKSIGDGTFENCNSLEKITIPYNVQSIGYGTFNYCADIKEFIVDENNKFFKSEEGVLYNYDMSVLIQYPPGKTDKNYQTPNSVKKIRAYAFFFNKYLDRVSLRNDVDEIGFRCFAECNDLRNVTLSNRMKKISDYCFYECSKLSSITVPSSVIEIGKNAFENCYSLEEIYFTGDVPSFQEEGANYAFKNVIATLYRPSDWSWEPFVEDCKWVIYEPK